ncbi:MAG: hypothetical protein MJE66_02725 [Proteobacteria bacterium]|nr:hypothetical protein [Pseudomonadota bacterium]
MHGPTSHQAARCGGVALALWILAAPPPAAAESALRLAPRPAAGAVPAATYDEDGRPIGSAHVSDTQLSDGSRQLVLVSTVAGGGALLLTARLFPTNDGLAFAPVVQTAESFDTRGRSLGRMVIDHRQRTARCGSPEPGQPDRHVIALDPQDRVANGVLGLLLASQLASAEPLAFDLLACTAGRLIPARATAPKPLPTGLVQVEAELNLGSALAWAIRPFLPRYAFWFDPASSTPWVAHRMTLSGRGQRVLVLHGDRTPIDLGLPPPPS